MAILENQKLYVTFGGGILIVKAWFPYTCVHLVNEDMPFFDGDGKRSEQKCELLRDWISPTKFVIKKYGGR